jgi:hypothetical protein
MLSSLPGGPFLAIRAGKPALLLESGRDVS